MNAAELIAGVMRASGLDAICVPDGAHDVVWWWPAGSPVVRGTQRIIRTWDECRAVLNAEGAVGLQELKGRA